MKLEDQVVSLELAQQLRALGFKQESYFYWCNVGNDSKLYGGMDMDEARINDHFKLEEVLRDERKHYWVYYSAFTVPELGEMLPWDIRDTKDFTRGRFVLELSPIKPIWKATYTNGTGRLALSNGDNNMVNSMAKLLIYLKENHLLDKSEKDSK